MNMLRLQSIKLLVLFLKCIALASRGAVPDIPIVDADFLNCYEVSFMIMSCSATSLYRGLLEEDLNSLMALQNAGLIVSAVEPSLPSLVFLVRIPPPHFCSPILPRV